MCGRKGERARERQNVVKIPYYLFVSCSSFNGCFFAAVVVEYDLNGVCTTEPLSIELYTHTHTSSYSTVWHSISHWIERHICMLSPYQSHRIQNKFPTLYVCLCRSPLHFIRMPFFLSFSLSRLYASRLLFYYCRMRFVYDGLTSWRSHSAHCH